MTCGGRAALGILASSLPSSSPAKDKTGNTDVTELGLAVLFFFYF